MFIIEIMKRAGDRPHLPGSLFLNKNAAVSFLHQVLFGPLDYFSRTQSPSCKEEKWQNGRCCGRAGKKQSLSYSF
jgi:hypothetical protein